MTGDGEKSVGPMLESEYKSVRPMAFCTGPMVPINIPWSPRKIIESFYKFCMEEEQSGLKISLKCDRTVTLTGVSRVTAQRILNLTVSKIDKQILVIIRRFEKTLILNKNVEKQISSRTRFEMYCYEMK